MLEKISHHLDIIFPMVRLQTHYDRIKDWLFKHDFEIQSKANPANQNDPRWKRDHQLTRLYSLLPKLREKGHR